ncbi:Uu.00g121840.m01.CDS01 [Anthostomella pinea]|uniref:Uu.00g121840.m01.CDS01 n=1 Tax=Anthostomella pinea TaxID=933095 RepID=A0AAI8VH32_9PEZI|nr:Uu.00g121840.m01.CDS01 [Anthostomella pinea]
MVSLLLEAGASQDAVDSFGWTAKEIATFRGHIATAGLFETSSPSIRLQDSDVRKLMPVDYTIARLDTGQKAILATLGFSTGSWLTLEIHAPGSTKEAHRVHLPILADESDEQLMFPIPENDDAHLVFRIFRRDTESCQEEVLLGSGIAVLESGISHLGLNRQSLVREHVVVVLDRRSMQPMGTILFSYVIAKPFPGLSTSKDKGGPKTPAPILVGHRGLGQNTASQDYLQIGENTIQSFLSAWSVLHVQITRDLEAVIYHDFCLSEYGTDLPIHDMTLDQYLVAGSRQSPRGPAVSILEGPNGEVKNDHSRRRARSLDLRDDVSLAQLHDRMKHTVDFRSKGFKPNARGECIQDSFTTLEEILIKLPGHIGFNIEIKYPRLHEAADAGLPPIAIELNTFIDTALTKIQRFGGTRPIILSSFTPEVCMLLALKQQAYPVMFITNAGKLPMTDLNKMAASVQVAVRFARRWKLAGLVFACEPMLLCPRLVQVVQAAGLKCGSYGLPNNEPKNAKLQAKAGVDLLFADRVGLIAKALEDVKK